MLARGIRALPFQTFQSGVQNALRSSAIASGRGSGFAVEKIEGLADAGLVEADGHVLAATLHGLRPGPLIDHIMIQRAGEEIAEPSFRLVDASDGIALEEMKEKSLHEIFGLGRIGSARDEEAEMNVSSSGVQSAGRTIGPSNDHDVGGKELPGSSFRGGNITQLTLYQRAPACGNCFP